MTKEEVIKEFRAREILEAARRVIGRFGFEGTTIDRVAEEAKVAKGTIYLYFRNKDVLLHAAILEGLRAMIAETEAGDVVDAPPLERITGLIRNQFRIQASYQDFLKAFFLESSFVNEPGDARGEELLTVYIGYLNFVAGVLKSAMDAGALRRLDPQFAAFTLTEIMTGCLRRRLIGLATTPVEEDADEVVELFLRGVIAR